MPDKVLNFQGYFLRGIIRAGICGWSSFGPSMFCLGSIEAIMQSSCDEMVRAQQIITKRHVIYSPYTSGLIKNTNYKILGHESPYI